MLNYNLDSIQSAEKLVKLCERHCDIADIDVNCGRHSIDGRSLMGVISLIGNFVTVNPQTDDQDIIRKFEDPIQWACKILREELVKHGDLYNAFACSIESSLKEQYPFRTESETADKILKRIIGEE